MKITLNSILIKKLIMLTKKINTSLYIQIFKKVVLDIFQDQVSQLVNILKNNKKMQYKNKKNNKKMKI